jgi:pimeloyl-ACP methyl ester carboxylesterase
VTTVRANGIEQHVQQMGPPGAGVPTVVCVHGILIDSLASFYFTLAKPLADAGLRVIMYDLRGQGRTERPPTGYTLDDYVDDLTGLLDQLDVPGPVYLIGNSFGGTIAFSFAVRHPGRAAGIAVIESEPASRQWAVKMSANLTRAATELVRSEALAWVTVRYGRHTLKLAKYAARMLQSTTLVQDLPPSAVPSTEQLRSLRCPVLAVYGADSDLAVQAPLLRALLSDCTTRVIPGQDHSVLVNVPQTIIDLVLSWLRQRDRVRMVGADET